MTLRVRPEAAADAAAIAATVTAAFGGPAEAELVARIRASDGFLPRLSLVAEEAGEILGHALFSRAWLADESGQRQPILALAPVAVRPDRQRQGIGTALIRAGLAAARDDESLAVVVGHPAYYPRFGFRPAAGLGIACPFPVPPAAFMALPLGRWHAGLVGRVVYPASFADT